MSQPLQPLTFPLHGTRLIEASAGTGKTYTIAALYLRLVLNGLTPPQILVVTFTDAATKELKDRIRARLVDAAKVFRHHADGDPLLKSLLAQYPTDQHGGCARRLELAAQWMDEAAVYTIHGWCNRMLASHAFAADSLFELTLETDQRQLTEQVLADYWRSQYYPLTDVTPITALWQTPGQLHQAIRPWLLPGTAAPTQPVSTLLAELSDAQQALMTPVKAQWQTLLGPFSDAIIAAHGAKQLNGNKVRRSTLESWLQALADWLNSEALLPAISDNHWQRFCRAGLTDAAKDGAAILEHPGVAALDSILAARAQLPDIEQHLAQHAAGWVQQRLAEEKQRRATLGFDDLLTRLDSALTANPALAALIRQQYPLAMIDEFQDTDPVQLRIFDSIYGLDNTASDSGLFLIGDPKQAIYGFRGADIFTYLRARKATAGRHYNLGTNYRSTAPLVAAVNAVFSHRQDSFLFADIPFIPVAANGRREYLEVAGEAAPAMTAWLLDSEQPLSSSQYRQQLADSCASAMVAMLNGNNGFRSEQGLTPLKPADMAVLVRGRSEADAIRQALFARGVPSVYLSDKESVYATGEARDLLAWLRAAADPENGRLLRAALATPTLGLSLAWLDQLNQDELAFETQVERFSGYQQRWLQRGVLPMIRQLLADFAVPATLLQGVEGERALTNLLHLAELLQSTASKLDGEQALIRFLAEAIADPSSNDDEILRLESDADLVKVITIHKSKGLEYPVVFLPFVMSYREADRTGPYIRYHNAQGQTVLDTDKSDNAYQQAEQERLAEDLRLLYVALTRPRHACFLGLAPIKMQKSGSKSQTDLHRSALGYLLTGGKAISNAELAEQFRALAARSDDIALQPAPIASDNRYQPATTLPPLQPARSFQAPAAEPWFIASYSALRTQDWQVSASTALEAELQNPDEPTDNQQQGQGSIHAFPRGPGPGTFLHGILEWAAAEGFAQLDRQRSQQVLSQRLGQRGWEDWAEPLQQWLHNLVQQPLPLPEGQSVALAELRQYQPEMEFWFSASQVQLSQLDNLVHRHTLNGVLRPPLSPGLLNGMLKGFIDLVFAHQGQYYVLDYKSNHLGDSASAYSAQAMHEVMRDKRYDLQYVLYLLALHRLLKSRIHDYDYDRHIGGAVYLFLRSGHCYVDKPQRELIETLDALFGGPDAGAA
ncbi:exodeoxyribonuclease V subunit beta [Gallaecimonas sp. GXIMD1310]|uniref:exodeoxyribonuclease V subunit beta n=1 Tax=Gallaecimonas sp. GXIMD1310 TaxID=3131926 RepID=UPI0032532A01